MPERCIGRGRGGGRGGRGSRSTSGRGGRFGGEPQTGAPVPAGLEEGGSGIPSGGRGGGRGADMERDARGRGRGPRVNSRSVMNPQPYATPNCTVCVPKP